MKRMFGTCVAVLSLACALVRSEAAESAPAAQPDLATLKQQYQDALVPIGTDTVGRLEKLKVDYMVALSELQKNVMADGDLDGTLAVKAELNRISTGAVPSDEEKTHMPARLKNLRETYQKSRVKIAADRVHREQELASRYETNLGVLEKKLTAQGNLEAALSVRDERTRLSVPPPAPAPPVQPTDEIEPWARQWTIEDNFTEPGQSSNPGTVLSNVWVAGEMAPGQYPNVPFYEGPGKRAGILTLHPATPDRPARLRREGVIDPAKPVLQVVAGGNVIGDCLLQCFADGKKVGEQLLTGTGWTTCRFDLSQVAGKKSAIEIRVAPGGANAWYYEHGFIDEISFVAKNAQAAK